MFRNTWNNIIFWFKDRNERNLLIREFNEAARTSFIQGVASTLLKASISKGDSRYKHQFSHWTNTGLRIQALTGEVLSKEELVFIGHVILSNNTLIRRLIVLGWDTLEVHGDTGFYGCKWQLKDFLSLPSFTE